MTPEQEIEKLRRERDWLLARLVNQSCEQDRLFRYENALRKALTECRGLHEHFRDTPLKVIDMGQHLYSIIQDLEDALQ